MIEGNEFVGLYILIQGELLDLFKGYESIVECYLKPAEQGRDFIWAYVK